MGVDVVFQSLLAELAQVGVKVRLVGADRIEVTGPRGRVSEDLRARLVRYKPELVEWLAGTRDDQAAGHDLPTIVADPAHQSQPFLPADLQRAFLVGSREGLEYRVRPHQYMEWDFDELDPARFEKALNQALRRQRANLVVVGEDVRLTPVGDLAPVEVSVTDLRHLPDAQARAGIERVRAAMERTELPLDRWPWLAVRITRYGQGRARLHYNNNNFFMDAPSTARFLDSVLHHYHHPEDPLPDLQVSYRDCVLALAELEASPRGQASKRYWCDRMADWPAAPQLPMTTAADTRQRSRLNRRELLFPADLSEAFRRAAKTRGLTLTNALLAGYAEVIAYWSGSRHFLLNNMITHRRPLHPQINEVLGNFAALYPLEVDWRPDEPFQDRARRLQAQVMSDVEHSYWSGVNVLQTLNQVRRTPGRAVCPFAVGSALFVGRTDRPVYSVLETPQTVLDCEFWDLPDGRLWVVWDVIEAMFPAGLIDAMQAGYRALLTRLARDGSAWTLTAFDLLPASQREQRDRLNRSGPPPPGGLLHDSLASRAAASPDKTAVVSSGAVLSYADLRRHGDHLAGQLRRHGTRPGDLVAVVLPKGWEQVVAVIGVLTAGAAYVPIDPAWPRERIRYLLADTAATAVLTSEALRGELASLGGVPAVAVAGAATTTPVEGLPVARHPDDLAYVIYTSGSTGRPKGAMLNHRGPVNTIRDVNGRFGIGAQDVLFGVSSLCFDLSVYDVFGALAAGATLVLPTGPQTDPACWLELARTHGVTVWNSVPALMQLLVEEAAAAGVQLPALRTVLLSGDWIPVDLPPRIREVAPAAKVVSLGGATEASIWSIAFPVDRHDPDRVSIPYGKPLTNQTWYVLDEVGRDAPTWAAGELYIGGSGLALGYLNDPDRTSAAFVTHPGTGERLYRTGDLGRYLPSGDIELLGRADFQVKIQGYRVEPGEIEQALLEHPDIRQAAVVGRASGSGRQLAAFVVGAAGQPRPEASGLAGFLAGRLPSYLVPSQISVLDRLPLTGNGKLDRRALERLGPAGATDRGSGPSRAEPREPAAPRTATETQLVEIWESVLSTSPVGIHDDFFDLGGQSFAALRVVAQIAQRLGCQVPLSALLESRTVAGLAGWLAAAEADWSPLVRLREQAGAPWFLVHPAGGNVLCYRRLAELLDRGCYALQAPGPASGREPLEKVEELAARYLSAVREVRPHGPYLLGGWSSGAVIAFEMAHQMEERGERVAQLVVIDAPAPVQPRAVDDSALLRWFLEDLGAGFDPARLSADQLRELAGLPEPDRVARALDLARTRGPAGEQLNAGPGGDGLAATFPVFRGVVRACNSYQAAQIVTGITVVRAERSGVSEFADHRFATSPDWGWSQVTGGRVAAATVPGTHHTLLTDPHVVGVAAAMNGRTHRSEPAAG
jgi:amino acid adenylation domain-containing protein